MKFSYAMPLTRIFALLLNDFIKKFISSVCEMDPFEVTVVPYRENYKPLFFRPKAQHILAPLYFNEST